MLYRVVVGLVLLCLCQMLPAAAVPEPAQDEPAEPLHLFRPQSVNMQRSLHFDEEGQMRQSLATCYIGFVITPTSENRKLLGYKELNLVDAVLDTGEVISPVQQQSNVFMPRDHNGTPRVYMTLRYSHPPAGSTSIAELSGSIVAVEADGPSKSATLPPFKDIDGKTIRIEDAVDGAAVVKVAANSGYITIEMNATTWMQCTKVSALLPDGSESEIGHTTYRTSGEMITHRLQKKLPDDTELILAFAKKVRAYKVPFTLENITLVGEPAEKPKRNDVIRIKAKERPVAPKADKPERPAGLKVIVQ